MIVLIDTINLTDKTDSRADSSSRCSSAAGSVNTGSSRASTSSLSNSINKKYIIH